MAGGSRSALLLLALCCLPWPPSLYVDASSEKISDSGRYGRFAANVDSVNRRKLYANETHRSHRWTSDIGKFTRRGELQRLEGTEGGEGPLRSELLGAEIRRENLKTVHLDFFRFNNDPGRMETLNCKGSSCPDFKSCGGNFSWVEACWKEELSDHEYADPEPPLNCPPLKPRPGPGVIPEFNPNCSFLQDFVRHERIGAQVYILRSVYINSRGNPLTSKYHIDRGGCACDGQPYVYPADTPVRVFREIVNLAHWNAYAFFHGVVELLPALLLLADVFRRNPNIPVAHREGQHTFLQNVGLPLLGIRADQLNIYEFKDKELLFGEKVYQPYYAPCARPSRAQWQYLRSHFLLPPDGIPMLNPDWSERKPRKIATGGSRPPPDWVAVLAKRYGERSLVQTDEVEAAMVSLFGRERVKIFDGGIPILEAKDLFNRARIYVAAHGAAMTNMFFMPHGSFIFEIRPNGYWNACFHFLAEVSRHKYYLVLGEGTKHTPLNANMTEVLRILTTIAEEINVGSK